MLERKQTKRKQGLYEASNEGNLHLKTKIFLSNKNDVTIEQSQKMISSSHE